MTQIQIMIRFPEIALLFTCCCCCCCFCCFFSISFFLLYYHIEWCQKWALWIFHLALHVQINRMLNRFMHRLCFIFSFCLTQFYQRPIMMLHADGIHWIVLYWKYITANKMKLPLLYFEINDRMFSFNSDKSIGYYWNWIVAACFFICVFKWTNECQEKIRYCWIFFYLIDMNISNVILFWHSKWHPIPPNFYLMLSLNCLTRYPFDQDKSRGS